MGKKGYELSPTLQLLRDPKGKSAHQISRIIAKWQIRNIKNRRINRPTEEFMKDLRLDIKSLGWHNNEEFRRTGKYPRSKFLFKLLQQYVALEYQYMSENHLSINDTIHYVLDLLKTFLNDYFGSRTEHTKYFLLYILNSSQRRFNLPQKYCRTLISQLKDDMYFDNSMLRKLENLRKRKQVLLIDEVYFNPSYQEAVNMDDYGTESESDSDELTSENTLWATQNRRMCSDSALSNSRFKKRERKKFHNVKLIVPKPEIVDLLSDEDDDVICLGSELNADNLLNIKPSKLNTRREEQRENYKHTLDSCDSIKLNDLKPSVPSNFFESLAANTDDPSSTSKLLITSIVSGISDNKKNQESNLLAMKNKEVLYTKINKPVVSTEKLPVTTGEERSAVRTKGERKVYTRQRSRSNSSDIDLDYQNNQQEIIKSLQESEGASSDVEIFKQPTIDPKKLDTAVDSNETKIMTVLDDEAFHSFKLTKENNFTGQKQGMCNLPEVVTIGTSQLFQEKDSPQGTNTPNNLCSSEVFSQHPISECSKEKGSLLMKDVVCEQPFQQLNNKENDKNELSPHVSQIPCEFHDSQKDLVGKQIIYHHTSPETQDIVKEPISTLQENEVKSFPQMEQENLVNDLPNEESQEVSQKVDFTSKNEPGMDMIEEDHLLTSQVSESVSKKDGTKFEILTENSVQNLDKKCDQEPVNTSLQNINIPREEDFQRKKIEAEVEDTHIQQVLDTDTSIIQNQPNNDIFLNDVTRQEIRETNIKHSKFKVLEEIVLPPPLEVIKHSQNICVANEKYESSKKEIILTGETESVKPSLQDQSFTFQNSPEKINQLINKTEDNTIHIPPEVAEIQCNMQDRPKETLTIQNEVEAVLNSNTATCQVESFEECKGAIFQIDQQSSDICDGEVTFNNIVNEPLDSNINSQEVLKATPDKTTPVDHVLCDEGACQKKTKVNIVTKGGSILQEKTVREPIEVLSTLPEGQLPVNNLCKEISKEFDKRELPGREIVESGEVLKNLPIVLTQEGNKEIDKERDLEHITTASITKDLLPLQEASICQNSKESYPLLLEQKLTQVPDSNALKVSFDTEVLEKGKTDIVVLEKMDLISVTTDVPAFDENKFSDIVVREEKDAILVAANVPACDGNKVFDNVVQEEKDTILVTADVPAPDESKVAAMEPTQEIPCTVEEKTEKSDEGASQKTPKDITVVKEELRILLHQQQEEQITNLPNQTTEPIKDNSFVQAHVEEEIPIPEICVPASSEKKVTIESSVEEHGHSITMSEVANAEDLTIRNMIVKTPQKNNAEVLENEQVVDPSCDIADTEVTKTHFSAENAPLEDAKDEVLNIAVNSKETISDDICQQDSTIENLDTAVTQQLDPLDNITNRESSLLVSKTPVSTDIDNEECPSDQVPEVEKNIASKADDVPFQSFISTQMSPKEKENNSLQLGSTNDKCLPSSPKTSQDLLEATEQQVSTAVSTDSLPSAENEKRETKGNQVISDINEENLSVGAAKFKSSSSEENGGAVAVDEPETRVLVQSEEEKSAPSAALPSVKSKKTVNKKSKVKKKKEVIKFRTQKTRPSTASSKYLKHQEDELSQTLKLPEKRFTILENQKPMEPKVTEKLSFEGELSTDNLNKKTFRGSKSVKSKQKRHKSVGRKRTKKSMVLKVSEESLGDLESIKAIVSNSNAKITPIDDEINVIKSTPIADRTTADVSGETNIETINKCSPNQYSLTDQDGFEGNADILKSKQLHIEPCLNKDIHFPGRLQPFFSIQANTVMPSTQEDESSRKSFMDFLGRDASQIGKIQSPKSNCDDSNLKILSMVAASIVDKNVKLPASRKSRKGQRRDSTRVTRSSAKTQRSLQSQFPESVLSNDDSCDSYDKLIINCDDTTSEQETVDERRNHVILSLEEKTVEVPMKKLNDTPIQPEPVPDVKDYISQHTNVSYVGNASPSSGEERNVVRTKGELKVYTEPRLRSKSCDVKASDPVPVQRRSSDDLPYNICNILRENTLSDDLKSPKLKTRWEAQNLAETSSRVKEAPNLKVETNIVNTLENSELTVSISQHESELVDKKIESQRKAKANKSRKSKSEKLPDKTVKGNQKSIRDKKHIESKNMTSVVEPIKNSNKDEPKQEIKKKSDDHIRTRPKTRSGKYEGPYVFDEDDETQGDETDKIEGESNKLSNKKTRDKKRGRSKIKEESKVSKVKDAKETCKQDVECSNNEVPLKICKTSDEAVECSEQKSMKKECFDVKTKKDRTRSRSKTDKNKEDTILIESESKPDNIKVIEKTENESFESSVKCMDTVNDVCKEIILDKKEIENESKAAKNSGVKMDLQETGDDAKERKIPHTKMIQKPMKTLGSKKEIKKESKSAEISEVKMNLQETSGDDAKERKIPHTKMIQKPVKNLDNVEVELKMSVENKAKKLNNKRISKVEEEKCNEKTIVSDDLGKMEDQKIISTAENQTKKHFHKNTFDVDDKVIKSKNKKEVSDVSKERKKIAKVENQELNNKNILDMETNKAIKDNLETETSDKIDLERKTSVSENIEIQYNKKTIVAEEKEHVNIKHNEAVLENKEQTQYNKKALEPEEKQCSSKIIEKSVHQERGKVIDPITKCTKMSDNLDCQINILPNLEEKTVTSVKEKQAKVDERNKDEKSTNTPQEKKKHKENFTNTEKLSENTDKSKKRNMERIEKPEEAASKSDKGEDKNLDGNNVIKPSTETTNNESKQLERKEEKNPKQKSRSTKKIGDFDEKEPKSKTEVEKNTKEKEKSQKKSDSTKKSKEKVLGEKKGKSKEKAEAAAKDKVNVIENSTEQGTTDAKNVTDSNDQIETNFEKDEEETVKDFSKQFNEIYKYARNSIKKNEELLTQHRDMCMEKKTSGEELSEKCPDFKITDKVKQKNSSGEKNLTEVTQKNFESFMKDLIKERKITQCRKTDEEKKAKSNNSNDEKKNEMEEIIPDDKNKNKALQQTVERMKSRLDQKRQLQEAMEKEKKKKRKIDNSEISDEINKISKEIPPVEDSITDNLPKVGDKTSDESQSGMSSGEVSSSSTDNNLQTKRRRKLKLNKYKVEGRQDSKKNDILAFVFIHKKGNRRPTMRRRLWRHPFVEDHELADKDKEPRGSTNRITINEIADKLRLRYEPPKKEETRKEEAPKVIVQRIPQSDDVFPDFIGIDGVLPVPSLPEPSKADDHKIGRYSIKPTSNIGLLGGPFLSAQVTAKSTENLVPTKLESSREGCDDSPVEVMLNLPEHTEQYLVGNGPPSQENPNDFPLTDQFFGFDHSIQDVCLIEPNGDNIPLQNICKEETVDFFSDQRLEEIAEQEITNQGITDQEIPDQYMSIGTMTELLLTVNGETSNCMSESDPNYIGEPNLNYIGDPGMEYATRPNEICSTDYMGKQNRIDINTNCVNDPQNTFDFEVWMSQNLFKNQDAPIVQDNNINSTSTTSDTSKQLPTVNQQDNTSTSTVPTEKPKRKGRKSVDYPPVKRKPLDDTKSSSSKATPCNELIFARYPRTRVCAPKQQKEPTTTTSNSKQETTTTNNVSKATEKKVEDTLLLPTPPIVDQSPTKTKNKSPRKQGTPTKSEDTTFASVIPEAIATIGKEPKNTNVGDMWLPPDKTNEKCSIPIDPSGRSSNTASVLTENRTKIWNPIGTPPRRKRKHSEQEPTSESSTKYHSDHSQPETPPKKQRRPSINIRDDIFENSGRDNRKSTASTSSFYEPPSTSSGRRTSISPTHMNPFSDDRRTTSSMSNYNSSPSASNRRTSISPTNMNSLFDQVRNSDPNNVPLPRNPYDNYKHDSRDSRSRQRRRSNDEPDRKVRQTYKPESRRRYHQVVDPQEVSESFRKKTSGFRQSNFRHENSYRPRSNPNGYDTEQLHQHAPPPQTFPQMSNSTDRHQPMSMPTLHLRHTMPYERRRESPPRQMSANPYSYSNGYPRHWHTQNYEGRPMSNIAEGNPRKEQQKQETIKKFWSWLEKGCQASNKKE